MNLKNRIAELISPVLKNQGFDLIELKLSRYEKNSRVQIYIDSDNGVNIDDCARISRMAEEIIDKDNLFDYGYLIEVSSPGLDRPLHLARDFQRRLGKQIQVLLNDIDLAPLKGELVSVDDENIGLLIGGQKQEISLESIKFGKIII
ncbi:MAG: ribosome maturation factor RimP [candidate division Zixibacteria bacterium]|nr:ribosome maturation factor RimP [candidate division Zixibacteria bacterium]